MFYSHEHPDHTRIFDKLGQRYVGEGLSLQQLIIISKVAIQTVAPASQLEIKNRDLNFFIKIYYG
tara:strand:- start:1229 stop:1423 length:195 start_codon:yes stop_codon:yes gene_type:complete